MRSYAIGDIHGQLTLLKAAQDRVAKDRLFCGDQDAPLVHVGDLVDRGPNSRGVVEHLMEGIRNGQNWVVLKGNHDRMFSLFIKDWQAQDPGLREDLSWLHPRLGGGTTLASYGVANASDRPVAKVHAEAVAVVPAAHLEFIDSLPTSLARGELLFVHAGVKPNTPLEAQSEDALLWIREPFLSYRGDFGAMVVHGHTALDQPVNYGNRVNIDSGAGYDGPLTAIVVEGRDVYVLTDKGRVALAPRPSSRVR